MAHRYTEGFIEKYFNISINIIINERKMPQLVPFYYMNELVFSFSLIVVILYLLSKYILPRIVRLFISRIFIKKIKE